MFTSFYLSLLGILYFKISLDTIKARRKHKVSLGVGQNEEILPYTSAHSNFQAYVPFIGLLLFFYENSELYSEMVLHALGLTVLAGRMIHYIGIVGAKGSSKPNVKFRVAGMKMTLVPLIILALLNLANFVYVTRIK